MKMLSRSIPVLLAFCALQSASADSVACGSWAERLVSGPGARLWHTMVFDELNGMSILVGGWRGAGNGGASAEVWGWNGSTWQPLHDYSAASCSEPLIDPGPRYSHTLAYDSDRNKIVLYGQNCNNNCPDNFNCDRDDTWEGQWDAVNSTWTWAIVEHNGGPGGLESAAMAYDTWRQEILLFGGAHGATNPPLPTVRGRNSNLWRWVSDGNNGAWELVTPTIPVDPFPAGSCATSTGPCARSLHAMAFDEERGVLLLFGGINEFDQPLNDTWEWNGTTWNFVASGGSNAPDNRYLHSMAYDSDRKKIVMFGGQQNPDTPIHFNDIWEWDEGTWVCVAPGVPCCGTSSSSCTPQEGDPHPNCRSGHGMAYDDVRHELVIVGGGITSSPPIYGDTWTFAVADADDDGVCDDDDNCPFENNPNQEDCDGDDIGDACELDCDSNGIPDECEPDQSDCNTNGIIDSCDIAVGTSLDLNGNGIPDECDNNPPTCSVDLSSAEASLLQPSPGSFVVTEGETITAQFVGDDPDGDDLTAVLTGLPPEAVIAPTSGQSPLTVELTWTPSIADKAGAPYTATVTFIDSGGESASCNFVIEDINLRPTCSAGADQELECTDPAGEFTTLFGFATDEDDDDAGLAYTWDVSDLSVILDDPHSPTPSGTFPIGVTMATLTVADGRGGVCTSDVVITVEDTTPPEVMCTTDLAALWPPNHKMRSVEVIVIGTDVCTAPEQIIPISVTVRSDEPDNATGNGDGNTTGDVNGFDGFTAPVDITADLTFDPTVGTDGGWVTTIQLRAERDGGGDGRSYIIDVDAVDSHGNLAEMSCVVVVPHDRRGR